MNEVPRGPAPITPITCSALLLIRTLPSVLPLVGLPPTRANFTGRLGPRIGFALSGLEPLTCVGASRAILAPDATRRRAGAAERTSLLMKDPLNRGSGVQIPPPPLTPV